jgi:hypothetical protein
MYPVLSLSLVLLWNQGPVNIKKTSNTCLEDSASLSPWPFLHSLHSLDLPYALRITMAYFNYVQNCQIGSRYDQSGIMMICLLVWVEGWWVTLTCVVVCEPGMWTVCGSLACGECKIGVWHVVSVRLGMAHSECEIEGFSRNMWPWLINVSRAISQ